MRSIGTSISSAVTGVVLAQLTINYGSVILRSERGFQVIFVIGAGAALIALFITAFIPKPPQLDDLAAGTADDLSVARQH
jgi:hypothetical protein